MDSLGRAMRAGVAAGDGALRLLFAATCAWSVAHVYYAQPLFDALSAEFGIGHAAIGAVFGVTQLGSLLALVLLVPLGDRVPRRRLALVLAALLGLASLAMALAASPTMLLASAFALGLLGTAMTQGMLAYAAAWAPPGEGGRMMGTVGAGVMVGLLAARAVAGVVADVAGWRALYAGSAAVAVVLLALLRRRLPALPAAGAPSYPRLLVGLLHVLRYDRVLQIRGGIALLMFAALGIFWSALSLPLGAPPHALSHTAIGAFGLAGLVGVWAAGRAGQWADRGRGQRATGAALLLLLAAWLPLAAMRFGLWTTVLGVVLLDLAAQAIHITNQSMILHGRPEAGGRLLGGYMLFYGLGSGGGATAATAVYARAGWPAVCLLGAAVSLAALVFWAATRRAMPQACLPLDSRISE